MAKILYLLILAFPLFAFCEEKLIRLSTINWEPYVGKNLKNMGPAAEIVRQALALEGYTVDFGEDAPWARALHQAEKGLQKLDGIFPEYRNKYRENNFEYSDPFFESPVGFYVRKEDVKKFNYHVVKSDLNTTYVKLKEFKFGAVRDYINEDKFDGNNAIKKVLAVDDERNIEQLIEKKVDLIFIDKFVGKFLLSFDRKFIGAEEKLTFLDPPVYVHKLYIGWSKKGKNMEKKEKPSI